MARSGKITHIAGFETGYKESHIDMLNSSATAAITSAWANTGTYSMSTGDKAFFCLTHASNAQSVGMTAAFQIRNNYAYTAGDAPCEFWGIAGYFVAPHICMTNATATTVYFTFNRWDGTELWRSTNTYALATTYYIRVWTYCEGYWPHWIEFYNSSGTLLDATITTSNKAAIYDTGQTVNTTSPVYFGSQGGYPAGSHYEVYWDDIVLTSGGPPPAVGVKISGTAPTGDGTDDNYIGEDAGAVTNDNVADASDATYATSNGGGGAQQTYTHATVPTDPGSTGNVLAVCGYARFARDAASGSGIAQVRMRTSSGATQPGSGATSTSNTDWKGIRGVMDRSVANAFWTSGTGSETSVQDVEFGILRNVVGAHLKASQCHLEVAWGNEYTDAIVRQTRAGQVLSGG